MRKTGTKGDNIDTSVRASNPRATVMHPNIPFLEFAHNTTCCMAPVGAKGVRYDTYTGRRRNLPRIGAFEVVLAVYRWRES